MSEQKESSFIIRYPADDHYALNFIDGYKKKNKLRSRYEAVRRICEAFQTAENKQKEYEQKVTVQASTLLPSSDVPREITELMEACSKKGCPCIPDFSEKREILCIVSHEKKAPTIQRRSIAEFRACSLSPIVIPMERKEELEQIHAAEMERVELEIDQKKKEHTKYHNQVERLKPQLEKTLKDFRKEHSLRMEAESKLKPMENIIIERDNAVKERNELRPLCALLQHDNDYKAQQIKILSESELLKENDSLRQELGKARSLIDELKEETEKLNALLERRQKTFNDFMFHVQKMLGDFKQNTPSELTPYDLTYYLRSVRKTIENFEGYIATVSI